MVEYFVILAPAASPGSVRAWLAEAGGRAVQAYGDRALIVELPDGAEDRFPAVAGIVGIHTGPVPEDLSDLDGWERRPGTCASRLPSVDRAGRGAAKGDRGATRRPSPRVEPPVERPCGRRPPGRTTQPRAY